MKNLRGAFIACDAVIAAVLICAAKPLVSAAIKGIIDEMPKKYSVLGVGERMQGEKKVKFLALGDPRDLDNKIDLYVLNNGVFDIQNIQRVLESKITVTLILHGKFRTFSANDLNVR